MSSRLAGMPTLHISLPEPLKHFVDSQVLERGFGSRSEYILDLIRRDQDRSELRTLMLDGAASPIAGLAGTRFFKEVRDRVRAAAGKAPKRRPRW